MAGFGTEILFFCGLGYVILGPKRMQQLLQHIARFKAEFGNMQRQVKSQISAEVEGNTEAGGTEHTVS